MARSSEYPDLTFVPPRAYGRGRDGKAVRYIVVHYTAGSERTTSAEDGASYDARRTDGVSTHYFVDSNSVVQCVLTKDRANTARHKGNRLGIQYELCGTVQTRAQWLDAASLPTLRNAAKQIARDCRKYGIPVRRLSAAQTREAWTRFPDGPRGIVGHVDCTNAYPEDGGDHTDPGREFPWDVLLTMVEGEMKEDDDMALSDAELDRIAKAVWDHREKNPYEPAKAPMRMGDFQRYDTSRGQVVGISEKLDVVTEKIGALPGDVLAALAIDEPDVEGISRVLRAVLSQDQVTELIESLKPAS